LRENERRGRFDVVVSKIERKRDFWLGKKEKKKLLVKSRFCDEKVWKIKDLIYGGMKVGKKERGWRNIEGRKEKR
jgi:hypothetical protein